MSESGPQARSGLYRFTAIGRALDPACATNRAVLWLMPAGGAVAALAGILAGRVEPIAAGPVAFGGAATVFGCWALTRELAPDDNPAAFVGAGLGLVASLLAATASLLLLFSTLLLARIVNRTVGVPARTTDSLAVAGLTVWATVSLSSALVGGIAALAFAADAVLGGGRTRQLVYAAVCLAGSGLVLAGHGTPAAQEVPLATANLWLTTVVAGGYAATMLGTRRIVSVADATGQPLSSARVRAGMLVGLLVALQALFAGVHGVRMASLVWACLAAVAVGRATGWLAGRTP